MARDDRWARGPRQLEVLTGTIDPKLVTEFRQARSAPPQYFALWGMGGLFVGAFSGLMLGVGTNNRPDSSTGISMIVLGAIVAALIMGGSAWHTYRTEFNVALRLWVFARANNLTYVGRHTGKFTGMIFSNGSSHFHTCALRTNSVRPVQFGNYQFTTGSGKSQQTHVWGYMAVQLKNLLPHIVLDAEGNNGLIGSNLPAKFDKNQRLRLEGDFDRYFRLYCPSGYERDALYLFTPDVMVRFIDNAAQLDVEIIDDWVYFYSKRRLVTLDPLTWSWMYSVIDSFLVKINQWERWRDDRLRLEALGAADNAPVSAAGMVPQPPTAAGITVAEAASLAPAGSRPPNPILGAPGVATEGKRLRYGMRWGSVIYVIVIAVAVTLWSVIFGHH